jgi:hypothetical protein
MDNVDVQQGLEGKTALRRVRDRLWSASNRIADPIPVCGALSDGDSRYPRPDGELCDCKEGWGGINCNGTLSGK